MTRGRPVRIFSKTARGLYAATWTFFLLATLGGIFDPAPGPDEPNLWPGALLLTSEAALLIRSLRLGLTIDDERVTSRGILRTRRFPRGSITRVKTTGYSGLVYGATTSGWWGMLKIRNSGRWVDLPQTVGPPNASKQLEAAAQQALGLPLRTPAK